MRRFRVCAYGFDGSVIMTGISVEVPETMLLHFPDPQYNDGRRVNPGAVAIVLARIVEEFARYGASECLLSYEPPRPDRRHPAGKNERRVKAA